MQLSAVKLFSQQWMALTIYRVKWMLQDWEKMKGVIAKNELNK